jgi:hypothetical protein
MLRLGIIILLGSSIGCSGPSPFVGHWMATSKPANLEDHQIELFLRNDGTVLSINVDWSDHHIYEGEGIWKQTSANEAIIAPRAGERGEPDRVRLSDDGLIYLLRRGEIQYQRQK